MIEGLRAYGEELTSNKEIDLVGACTFVVFHRDLLLETRSVSLLRPIIEVGEATE